jgi:predicted RND superfamily exporter protein
MKSARVLFFMKDIGAVALDELFTKIRARSESLRDIDLRPTGLQVVANMQVSRLIEEVKVSFFFAFIVISVLMGIVFMSLRHGLIALVPNSFPLLATAAFMYVTGQHLRIVAVMTFAIAFGLAVDNTIHIFVRYRRELRRVGSVEEAVARALESVGDAVWTTSLLLLVGFCVLFFSGFKASFDFGVLACVTILAALIGDLMLLPALLRLLGKHPGKHPGRNPNEPLGKAELSRESSPSPLADR